MKVKRYVLAVLAAVVALVTALTLVLSAAAETPKISVTNTGGIPVSGTNKCEYTLRFEICQLTVSNNSTFDVEIVAVELVGTEAKTRYGITTSGCSVKAVIKSGKTCTDEVKLTVNGSTLWTNFYFIEVKDVNSKDKVGANAVLTVK